MPRPICAILVLLAAGCSAGDLESGGLKTDASAVTAGHSQCRNSTSVTAYFGSYAMGIDRRSAAAIEKVVAGASGISKIQRTPEGREGEYSLAVTARSARAACRLQQQMVLALPAKPLAPIRISGPMGPIDRP